MTIGVYRLYVSHAWAADPAFANVIAALDANSAFLYRLDRLSAEDLPVAMDGGERNAVRVAMTQAHVMLAPFAPSGTGNQPAGGTDATGILLHDTEMALARTGFRRRIPVLGIAMGATVAVDLAEAARLGFDCVVAIEPAALTCAIQELAEGAAAERRAANAIALQTPLADLAEQRAAPAGGMRPAMVPVAAPMAGLSTGPRALPVTQIIEAFRELVAARQSHKPAT